MDSFIQLENFPKIAPYAELFWQGTVVTVLLALFTVVIGFCLALCAWLRQVTPGCRLMLMCPENQAEAVHRAIEAKRRGQIDDFVFYDVSLDYLAASLQSL